jgi:hypothetical protein
LLVSFGGAAAWGHARESRAAGLAVKHGFAASKGEATLADRCAGVMTEDYKTTTGPRKAGIGEQAFAAMVPEICELGVARGLIADDGTMSEESGFRLTTDVMNTMGQAKVQTLMFTELAVTYGLARPGKVTRYHRCVAMAYAGWDAAQAQQAELPSKSNWRRGAREGCARALERGLLPASGSPKTGTAEEIELMGLICSAARRSGSCV